MPESPEIAALAKQARDGLARLERLADDADHRQPWTVATDWGGPKIRVNDTLDGTWVRDGAGVSGAYTCDPERLRADVAARRTLGGEEDAGREHAP
jgi:hypothetical protein